MSCRIKTAVSPLEQSLEDLEGENTSPAFNSGQAVQVADR